MEHSEHEEKLDDLISGLYDLMNDKEFEHLFNRTRKELGESSYIDFLSSIFRRAIKQLEKEEHQELINEGVAKVKAMPWITLEEIQAAKEASRPIPESVEKVLLFRELILTEEQIYRKGTNIIDDI